MPYFFWIKLSIMPVKISMAAKPSYLAPIRTRQLGCGSNENYILNFPSSSSITAKYEIQKPSTCRTTLFPCKFWVDVSCFSPCVFNLSCNKNIYCGLKTCSALIGWFAWCESKTSCQFNEKRAKQRKFVAQRRPKTCNKTMLCVKLRVFFTLYFAGLNCWLILVWLCIQQISG